MSSIQNAVERLRSLEQRLVKMQQGAAEQADQQIEQSQPTAPSTDIGNELQPLIDDVRAALNELGASGAAEQPQEE